MNLQQLRLMRETIRQNFNLTRVSEVLYTSQPGISKHLRDFEAELGVEVFERKGKRLLGLTPAGHQLAYVVERMVEDSLNLKRIADSVNSPLSGNLTIATTHTQARYVLPPVIKDFRQLFANVHLCINQDSPDAIAAQLLSGQADVGIATESLVNYPDLVTFPCYEWHHVVIVPIDHPLAKQKKVSLAELAKQPLITYHEGFTGRTGINRMFAEAQLKPDVVLSAMDADVIKTYVAEGLGVGIVAMMALENLRDPRFTVLETVTPFPINQTVVALRKNHFLKDFVYKFVTLLTPGLDFDEIKQRHLGERGVNYYD